MDQSNVSAVKATSGMVYDLRQSDYRSECVDMTLFPRELHRRREALCGRRETFAGFLRLVFTYQQCWRRQHIYGNGEISAVSLLWTFLVLFDGLVWLNEWNCLLLEYCVDLLIEYSSTRLIPEVVINCRVVQKTDTWFLIQVFNRITVWNES